MLQFTMARYGSERHFVRTMVLAVFAFQSSVEASATSFSLYSFKDSTIVRVACASVPLCHHILALAFQIRFARTRTRTVPIALFQVVLVDHLAYFTAIEPRMTLKAISLFMTSMIPAKPMSAFPQVHASRRISRSHSSSCLTVKPSRESG